MPADLPIPPHLTRRSSARWWSVVVGLVTATMGVIFCWFLWSGYRKAASIHNWDETPCVITRSEVEAFRPTPHSAVAYRFHVEYAYAVGGDRFVSEKYRRVEGPTKHEKKANALAAAFPEGSETTCYINPENPSEAVLKRDTKAPLYTIWFPALFIAGGLGISIGALARRGGQSGS